MKDLCEQDFSSMLYVKNKYKVNLPMSDKKKTSMSQK